MKIRVCVDFNAEHVSEHVVDEDGSPEARGQVFETATLEATSKLKAKHGDVLVEIAAVHTKELKS